MKHGKRALTRSGVIRGVAASLFAALLVGGASAPAIADEPPIEISSGSVQILTGLDGDKWRVDASNIMNFSGAPVQLRVPSRLVSPVPAEDEYAWLGPSGSLRWDYRLGGGDINFKAWAVKKKQLSADAPYVNISISNVVAPGELALYEEKVSYVDGKYVFSPGELFRWGTGIQRDGSEQNLDNTFQLAAFTGTAPVGTSFSASGMYCFDVTSSAVLADGTPVSDTTTIRMAVGDTVAADAACGTASNEDPGEILGRPSMPERPVASVEGDSVSVEWQPPASGEVTGYTVKLTGPARSFEQQVDSSVTRAVFEDVPKGNYRATVVASNQHGSSQPSSASNEVTVGDPIRVVDSGHIDAIAPQVDVDEATGELSLALRGHDDSAGWLDWDEMVLYSTVKRKLPAEFTPKNDWSFIGEPGQTIWELPFNPAPGAPWAGLSTEDSGLREHAQGSIGITYDAVVGQAGAAAPGGFGIDPTVHSNFPASISAGTGLRALTKEGLPGGYEVPVGTHEHFAWYFTEPGVYCTAVTVDAVLSDGKRHTQRGLLTQVVGDTVDPTTVTPCAQNTEFPEVGAKPSADPQESSVPFVVDEGMADVSISLSDGALDSGLLHSTSYRNATPERHALEDVILRGGPQYFGGPNLAKGRYAVGAIGTTPPAQQRSAAPYRVQWNTYGVPADQLDGDLTWSIGKVEGPGDFSVRTGNTNIILDSATGLTSATLAAHRQVESAYWEGTAPGRYCIDMTWSAKTKDHGTVSHTETVTVLLDGLDHEYGPEAYEKTCVDGAKPTPPGGGEDPDPEPEEQPWNVPNWSETESGAKILNLGHVDVASVLTDGKLDTKVKDTTAEGAEAGKDDGWVSWHEPEDTVFQLLPGSEAQVPQRDEFRFLGEAGAPMWAVRDTQDFDLLWPGWSTEHIDRSAQYEGVDWKLTGMEGPGDFFLYQLGGEGPDVHFNTADGIDAQDTVLIHPRAHVHGTWAFTAEGTYCLAFERTATINGEAHADAFTLAVAVGETDPTKVDPRHCEGTEQVVTVPQAPGKPSATADGDQVTVQWAAPAADGGSPITGYTVQLLGGEQPLVKEVAADALEAVFDGVPAGTYTATVVAVNAKGASEPSPASNPVTVKAADDEDPGDEPGDQVMPVPDDELTDANRGSVEVPEAATRGQQITVKVGQAHAGEQVRVWLHSTPMLLGTVTLDAGGNTVVTIPNDAMLGDHKVVVQAIDGSLIGWDGIKIGKASQVGPNGEWLASTGADAGLLFPLSAAAGILLLLGAVILVGTAKRRREVTNRSARG